MEKDNAEIARQLLMGENPTREKIKKMIEWIANDINAATSSTTFRKINKENITTHLNNCMQYLVDQGEVFRFSVSRMIEVDSFLPKFQIAYTGVYSPSGDKIIFEVFI
jgi:hypothetical protein